MAKKSVRAVAQKIVHGRYGRYVVAISDEILGSITFFLTYPYWKEVEDPEAGTILVLSKLRKKRAGWRSLDARYLKPSDEEKT